MFEYVDFRHFEFRGINLQCNNDSSLPCFYPPIDRLALA